MMNPSSAASCSRCRRYRILCGASLGLFVLASIWTLNRWHCACLQREGVAALSKNDSCHLGFDGQGVSALEVFVAAMTTDKRLKPLSWTEVIFDKHWLHQCNSIRVHYQHVDEILPHLSKLPYLQRIVVSHEIMDDSEIDNEGYQAALSKIRGFISGVEVEFTISDMRIGDSSGDDEELETVAGL